MLLATVNEAIALSVLAADGRTDLYGQVRVYNPAGSLVSTLDMTHVTEGLYSVSYTPSTEGVFSLVYELYFDAGRTVSAGYGKEGEALDVNSFRTNILRILGLVHQNSVVDSQIYDSDQNLTYARIRCYDSTANASAAAAIAPAPYNTGKIFEYEVNAAYSGGVLSKYHIAKIL
jgi:hypothetical protein